MFRTGLQTRTTPQFELACCPCMPRWLHGSEKVILAEAEQLRNARSYFFFLLSYLPVGGGDEISAMGSALSN